MELGKIYELTGQIDGICDFHTFRAGTTAETLLLYVPREHQSLVVPHQLYQIRFNSVAQKQLSPELMEVVKRTRIGMNWGVLARMLAPTTSNPTGPFRGPASLVGRVYEIRGNPTRFRFDFWRPTFEAKMGLHFEAGLTHLIRGTIVGICDFGVEHEQTEANQHVQIEVPEKWRGAFRHGETYEIRIESVARKEITLSEQEIRLGEIWDWEMVAAWIDTEGCYIADASTSTYTVRIYQKEALPLSGICAFLRAHGVECTVTSTLAENPRDSCKKSHIYELVTWGAEGLARVIRNTEPYIRTQNKRNQIIQCKEELARPRKRLEEKVVRARLLLGIPPEGNVS